MILKSIISFSHKLNLYSAFHNLCKSSFYLKLIINFSLNQGDAELP